MNSQARPFNKPLFTLFAICSLAAVFYIPYHVPQTPSLSLSWMFGYNNRAGIAILVLALAIALFWVRGVNISVPELAPSSPLPRWLLWTSLLVVLIGCITMYFIAQPIGAGNEAKYQIERIWLLSHGQRPYLDFEFAYGPLIIYGPLALERLCKVDVVFAYFLFWMLTSLAGIFLTFKLVSDLNYPVPVKRSTFLALLIPGILALMALGTNYTFFRFVTPLYLICVYQRLVIRSDSKSRIRSTLACAGFNLALLLISPELAIAFAVASIFLFLVAAPPWNSSTVLGLAALVTSLSIEFVIATRLHVLDTLKDQGSGTNSFPIAIAPHILLYIGSLFLCLCILLERISKKHLDDLNIGLVSISVPMIPAALGRSDPGHVFWYGLGIFTATMLYLSDRAQTARRYRIFFLAVVVILPATGGFLLGRIGRRNHTAPTTPQNDPVVSLDALYPAWQGRFLAPFGFEPNGVPALSTRIDYGRFDPFTNHTSVNSILESIDEMRDKPDKALLLPAHFETFCEPTNTSGFRVAMSFFFGFPYFGRAVHSDNPRAPLCQFITDNYQMAQAPDEHDFHYGLWVRKTDHDLPAGTTAKSPEYR